MQGLDDARLRSLLDRVHPEDRAIVEQLAEQRRELERLARLYDALYAESSIAQHGVLDDGAPFLQKPIVPSSLLRKVREVLSSA